MSKLLPNLPIENLTVENDYLGIIDKGEIIKTFLESNTEEFSQIKMFSLYGEWGSGKSTLMRYLQKELKGTFNTFFFEAWEFESDSNLSLSLLEYVIRESEDSTKEALGEILDVAEKLFKGFSKAITIKTPIININGKELVQAFEEEKDKTFLQLKKEFKKEFVRWEDNITKGKNPKYNIVFIDDLDRCEPENVLNLLSALKLFFTYGKKTIFFCGVDKKAVNEAVKTKYGKVVKANEYLEKIFDISFSMPEHEDLFKLVSQYFNDIDLDFGEGKLDFNISSFFKSLKFTNPRRVKKVLNKFQILKSIKSISLKSKKDLGIQNFYTEQTGNYFETIFTIFLIILHEFYPTNFDRLFDLKYKEACLLETFKKTVPQQSYDAYKFTLEHFVKNDMANKRLSTIAFSNNQFQDLVFIFLPNNIEELNSNSYSRNDYDNIKVVEKNKEYRFLKYVLNHPGIVSNSNEFSEISLNEMKQLIKKFL